MRRWFREAKEHHHSSRSLLSNALADAGASQGVATIFFLRDMLFNDNTYICISVIGKENYSIGFTHYMEVNISS